MKIAILSCFYPFRGGIAQFNAAIVAELGKFHDVKAFNFTRQYPSFLFPGKTQYVSQEDKTATKIDSESVLDTANPFNWSRAAKQIKKWHPDMLILRYWMSYFAPSLGLIARKMDKSCKVVAIVDNAIPHEPHFFDKPLTKYFLRGTNGVVALCDDVASDIKGLSSRPVATTVIPHPVYTHFGNTIERSKAEELLGIPHGSKNLLFFGLIRKYKGLDVLIKAFGGLDKSYRLIIAGEPYGSFEEYEKLIDESPNKSRIHIFARYIPDSEVGKFFSVADVTVLPYRSATQSGISAVSNHFEVPMIVTDKGGLKETIGDKGLGIVCRECSPECIGSAIERYFHSNELAETFKTNIRKENSKLSWSGFCRKLVDFAEKL